MTNLSFLSIFLTFLNFSYGFSIIDNEAKASCFQAGECTNSDVLDYTTASDEYECLTRCNSNTDCQWFTFAPALQVCFLYRECTNLDAQSCENCLSGQPNCVPDAPLCSTTGKCLDNILFFNGTPTEPDCLNMCKTTKECRWYTYSSDQELCILLSGCDVLDESSQDFVSGERRCSPGFSKILVATGFNGTGLEENEVIDLAFTGTLCQFLPGLPLRLQSASGGLAAENKPIVCGGFPHLSGCFSYANRSWAGDEFSLNTGRHAFAMTKSPFAESQLFITGGFGLNTSEVLKVTGWEYSVLLPTSFYHHCMVLFNATSVMLISGYQDSKLSSQTHIFNSETNVWTEGPSLIVPRSISRCGMIRRNRQTFEKSLIVVGGEARYGEIDTVEILDSVNSNWRMGPLLPFGISMSALVEDPMGGVILVGGLHNGTTLGTMYKLDHAGEGTSWVEMPQRLRAPRYTHTAFMIPSELSTCN